MTSQAENQILFDVPQHSMVFARGVRNGARLYAIDPTFEWVETFDVASRKSLGKFTLSEGRTHVRMNGFNVDPGERFASTPFTCPSISSS